MRLVHAEMLRGDVALSLGNRGDAIAAWTAALGAWPRNAEVRPEELSWRSMLLRRLGKKVDSEGIERQLAAIGYRHPSYVRDGQI